MKKLKNILVTTTVILLLAPISIMALTVTAHVDKNHISMEDAVFLKVEVDASDAKVDVSGITDFSVRSRGTSSMTRMINGSIERKITYQYMLMPLKEGKLEIPPITATHKGETSQSEKIEILVEKEQTQDTKNKSFFSTAELSKLSVYTGQQVVYTLKFYNSKQIAGLGFESPPGFGELSARPFEKEKTYTQRINGVLYRVTRVDYLISPSDTGTFEINPAVLLANVVVQSRQPSGFDSFFNDSFFSRQQTRPVRVTSNPVSLTVKPLPEYKENEPFSGLIGRFGIKATVDKEKIKAGESITLSIEISGSGNIMDAAPPTLELDEADFKVYDDTPAEDIRMTETGYEGKKQFKKAIVPIRPGNFIIPAMSLVYFDVDAGTFHTVSTAPIALDVQPSQAIMVTQSQGLPATPVADVQKEVALVNRDILEIKEGLHVLEDQKQMSPVLFFVCLVIPGVLFSGVKVYASFRQKEISNKKAMMKKARKHLERALKGDIPDEDFWANLYAAVTALVLSRADRRSETLTRQEARTILAENDFSEADIENVTRFLGTVESIRFGGERAGTEIKAKLAAHARAIFKKLGVFLVIMLSLTVVPHEASATPSEHYFKALKNYQDQDYKNAARQFEAIAEMPVKNAHLYFNIGNAYLKAGDIGRAILWYERSKKMSPGDPDLEYNLKFAQSRVKDRVEKNFELTEVVFFWDNMIGTKNLQYLAMLCSAVFFLWAAVRTLRRKPVFSGTGMLFCALLVLSTTLATISMIKSGHSSQAIVIAEKIDVRSGTMQNATILFSLHAGTKVRVDEIKDRYYKIIFSGDKIGWVEKSSVELI